MTTSMRSKCAQHSVIGQRQVQNHMEMTAMTGNLNDTLKCLVNDSIWGKILHIPPALKIDMPHETKGSKKENDCAKACHTEQSSENSVSHYEDENQCEFHNNSMARKQIVRKRCGLCKKLFDNQKLLNLHMKLQHKDYKYVCSHEKCTYLSVAKADVKKHIKKYGAHKFLCTFCGKGFHLASELNKHLKVHSDERNDKCSFGDCTCTYKMHDKLKWHQNKIHVSPDLQLHILF